MQRLSWQVGAGLALWLLVSSARAQTPEEAAPAGSGPELDRSAELFREGRALLREGRSAEACSKFEQSLELRRSPGTWLNIGSCREGSADLPGAVRAFRSALTLAQQEADADKAALWSQAARQNLERLEPRVAELRLTLADSAGVEVSLDGAALRVPEEPIVLEPGTHQLRARAPGMQEFALGVELVAGVKLALTIPRLSPASSAAPAPAPASTDARSEARVQATGPAWHWWLLGGAGALLVAGGVVGAIAADQAGELKQRCPERNCPDGLSPVRDVKRTALIADGLYGASLLTAGIGLVLLLNESDGAAAPLGAGCAGGGCGVTLSGRF